jgi:predicted outer membrane repeat protein
VERILLRFDGGIIISFLKKKMVLYLLVLIIGGFLFCGASSAAIINVNPGTGTIQTAVTSATAGDTLNLSAGTYNDHTVTVDKNLIIQGPTVSSSDPTAVVDGQKAGRIFTVNSGVSVTLQNLFIRNGNTIEDGGGIANSGNLIIDSCTFNNNQGRYGGAIDNWGTCTVTGSTFINNQGMFSAGAIANPGTCTVTNNVFTSNNVTYDGGAIYSSGTCTVTNNVFTNNNASSGGAIWSSGGCILTGCTFTNNHATGYGGAIFNQGTFTVTNNNFANNNAGATGGAIINFGGDSSSRIVNYNRFYDNLINEIFSAGGSVNAMYNWWGSNNDPSSKIGGSVDVSHWLVLSVNATPNLIKKNGTSTITSDLNHDCTGATVTGHVMDGIPITFTTTLGTINSPLSTVNGVAAAILHGGILGGTADINASLDDQIMPTAVIIDITAPTVSSTNPAQYAVNLPSNQVFTVTFNEAIKASNLNLVVLKTSTGTIIATTKSITGNVLTITPNSALGEAKYLLLLYAGSVTDLAGNPSAALSRTYGVGAQPFVTSTDPANYAVNVARNKVITATFNEPIVAKYLTLIYLKTVTGGIQVATTKSVSGNTLTITPTTPLAAGTRYLVLIYTFAVTDLAGNSNVNKQFTFTSGAT